MIAHILKRPYPVIVLFVLACSSVPEKPGPQYRAGMTARREGDIDEAFQYFQKTIELDPGHREAQLALASLHMQRNEPDHAVAHMTNLIDNIREVEGNTPPVDLFARRGEIYYRAGNYEKAIEDTSRAIRQNPDLSGALNTRGLAHVARQSYGKAKADFRRSLEIEENAQAHLGLAIVQMRRSNWEKAVQKLDRALQINESLARAYKYRAVANRERNRPDAMKEDLRSYLKLENPNAPEERIRKRIDELFEKYREKGEG